MRVIVLSWGKNLPLLGIEGEGEEKKKKKKNAKKGLGCPLRREMEHTVVRDGITRAGG